MRLFNADITPRARARLSARSLLASLKTSRCTSLASKLIIHQSSSSSPGIISSLLPVDSPPSARADAVTVLPNTPDDSGSPHPAVGAGVCVPSAQTPSFKPRHLCPLSSTETLEVHKRPEGGEGPAKLGVVTLPDSQGAVTATDKHSRAESPTGMDGLAVEVRGSNGAFYKVTCSHRPLKSSAKAEPGSWSRARALRGSCEFWVRNGLVW